MISQIINWGCQRCLWGREFKSLILVGSQPFRLVVSRGTTITQIGVVHNNVIMRYKNMNNDPSASPCNRRCCLDGDLCTGCYRTRTEIVSWRGMSQEDRIRVNLEAMRRREEEHND